MPLGSCALAGTTYPIDRDFVREQLGFARSDRQQRSTAFPTAITVLSLLSMRSLILMMHLSRLSEEIISWCSWEFKFD